MPRAYSCLLLESARNASNSADVVAPWLAGWCREIPRMVPHLSHPPVAYADCAGDERAVLTLHPGQARSRLPSPYVLLCLPVGQLSAPPVAVAESLWKGH